MDLLALAPVFAIPILTAREAWDRLGQRLTPATLYTCRP